MTNLAGQTAVITGASRGVGRAIALRLAREGAGLWLLGRDRATLEEVARLASATADSAKGHEADLRSEQEIAAFVVRLRESEARVDILVHAAGIIALGRMEEASIGDLDRQYETNVRGPYALTQALLPLMTPFRSQIVFLNSSAGLSARGNVGQYAATKHALRALADSLREELNPRGIRVTSIYLGRTATPMQAAVHETEGRPYVPDSLLQPEDVASVVVNALALPLTAEVTDVSIRPLRKPGEVREP